IQQRELQNNIKITGEINQDEIKSIFDNSFAYIQTSSYESQGIAIFEAMATGLPILTTNQLALEGIFQDGQNGFFIDYDPQDIGQKICIIFNNELLFSKISSNNIIKSQFFIWDNTIFQTLNVYLSYVK
ncbi:MAG: glycosyltransferase, partial [Bacteroidetes bacterium]|nr:glycosyltransferase [Bacteroidota bacterium]